MSGRRTWMPGTDAGSPDKEAQAYNTRASDEANVEANNRANTGTTHQDNAESDVGHEEAHSGLAAPDGTLERGGPEKTADAAAPKPSATSAPSGTSEPSEAPAPRTGRTWMPGQTESPVQQKQEKQEKQEDPPDPGTAPANAGDKGNQDATVMQTAVMDAPAPDTGSGQLSPKQYDPADDDTADIPLIPRRQSDQKGRQSSQHGREAESPGDGQQTRQTEKAGLLNAVRGRIGGRGPLSAEREEQDRDEASQQPVEPGGSMDPNERMKRIKDDIRSGDYQPSAAEREEETEREGLIEKGPLLWLIDHWLVLAAPIVLVCVGLFVFATMFTSGSSGGEIASSEGGSGGGNGSGEKQGGGAGKETKVPLYESGLVFDYSQTDGKAELTAGDLVWEGEVEAGGNDSPAQTVTLAGPTAAKINRGYEMDSGSDEPGEVDTMTFAVESEGAPDVHATYQRFSGQGRDGPLEAPNGSYSVTADSGELIAEGNYSDQRTGEGENGNEVIRTYTETIPGGSEPERFRARYEAPEGAPIPALVGWQEPEQRQAAAGEQG